MDHPEQSVELDNAKIHAVEPTWYERGMREVMQIHMVKPSLKEDQGRFNHPTLSVWGEGGGGFPGLS